jgi:hypothetical protein
LALARLGGEKSLNVKVAAPTRVPHDDARQGGVSSRTQRRQPVLVEFGQMEMTVRPDFGNEPRALELHVIETHAEAA